MRSAETLALFQTAREIRVALGADGARIGESLNERLPSPMEGEAVALDYPRHLRHLAFLLDAAVEETAVAEDEHAAQRVRVSRARDERDEIAAQSYEKFIALRQLLEGLFHRGGFELASIKGRTPRNPSRLGEQLGQTVKVLRQPAVDRRQVAVAGFSVDFGAMADDLEQEHARLSAAIEGVANATKALEGLLLGKRRAIAELRGMLTWVGGVVDGLFRLAGEDELARRVRTSASRRGRAGEAASNDSQPAESTVGEEVVVKREPFAITAPRRRRQGAFRCRARQKGSTTAETPSLSWSVVDRRNASREISKWPNKDGGTIKAARRRNLGRARNAFEPRFQSHRP